MNESEKKMGKNRNKYIERVSKNNEWENSMLCYNFEKVRKRKRGIEEEE